jgi:predicted kinase
MIEVSMSRFFAFADRFKETATWATMVNTVENSPWHREANVAVHTQMILNFYNRNLAHQRSESMQMLTLLAALFHDTGKPPARTPKTRADGTEYHVFAGHEQLSARVLEDYMMENQYWTIDQLRLTWPEFRAVKWMIEHHLPYDIKKPEKRAAMKRDLVSVLGGREQAFYDLLLSDCMGRISDDHAEKIARVEAWIEEFKAVEPAPVKKAAAGSPIAYILVGASGSGKSTFIRDQFTADVQVDVVSLDQYRINFAHEQNPPWFAMDTQSLYRNAFQYANDNDAEFRKYYNTAFMKTLAEENDVVVDNTNTSKKSRAYWIAALRQKGYRIAAVEFPIALATLVARQETRGDKRVPTDVVKSQYNRIASPAIGAEVDEVWIFDGKTMHLAGKT